MRRDRREPETLGQRIQRLRQERELSQAELGQSELSRRYVDAVERDRVWPSDEALALLAIRLDVPVERLRGTDHPTIRHADQAAVDEDIAYQLVCARAQLNNDPHKILDRIALIEQEHGGCLPALRAETRFWLHNLRGMALLRTYEPGRAQPELDAALRLAPQLAGAAREVIRVRNAKGASYYMRDQPESALREHEACLTGLRLERIDDPRLWLIVYSNIANDYWALNDVDQAIGMYQEALKLLEQVDHAERRAGVYWGLALGYMARGDLARAKLFACRALAMREADGDTASIAHITNTLGDIETRRGEYEAAEMHLGRARTLFASLGDDLYVGQVLKDLALLELARDRAEQAREYVEQALQRCEEVHGRQEAATDVTARANAIRTQAQVLATAGQIAEKQGDQPGADAFFSRAIAVSTESTCPEVAFAIEQDYAELLVQRGAHGLAVAHYRAAASHCPRRWSS